MNEDRRNGLWCFAAAVGCVPLAAVNMVWYNATHWTIPVVNYLGFVLAIPVLLIAGVFLIVRNHA
jgi:hypothetical protein